MKSIFNRLTGRSVPVRTPQRRQRLQLGDLQLENSLYAVGDVHGCFHALRDAEARIIADIEREQRPGIMILLGDYVDRGPDSRAVIDHLLNTPIRGLRRLALCGNHDDAFLRFLRAPSKKARWLEFGGRETLISYGIDIDHIVNRGGDGHMLAETIQQALPVSHIRFLRHLPVCATIGRFIFVHAGIRPGVPLEEQSDEDLMLIREPFLTEGPRLVSVVVIHGHTISDQPTVGQGRIGIDTGAFLTDRLTVLKLANEKAEFI